jgi:hypothetical protein
MQKKPQETDLHYAIMQVNCKRLREVHDELPIAVDACLWGARECGSM